MTENDCHDNNRFDSHMLASALRRVFLKQTFAFAFIDLKQHPTITMVTNFTRLIF